MNVKLCDDMTMLGKNSQIWKNNNYLFKCGNMWHYHYVRFLKIKFGIFSVYFKNFIECYIMTMLIKKGMHLCLKRLCVKFVCVSMASVMEIPMWF
jgi:hypothetical protein